MTAFHFHQGTRPLLVSMPHVGLEIPDDIKSTMTDDGLSMMDTDWYIDELYNFLQDMDVSILRARYSRYVVDLNRSKGGGALYPGQNETTLCPTHTFDNKPLYKESYVPDVEARVGQYWQPYHDQIRSELDRMNKIHGRGMLWDAHSIKSQVPHLFDGRLPDLNLGTGNGISADHGLVEKLDNIVQSSPYSAVLNGRFKGGYITRNYGDPKNNFHAVQLEIVQVIYMDEAPLNQFRDDKADQLRPVLKALIKAMID
ncbi:MAG: N-formylglutamate deformylase [Proteobacteria bacterium]|jgi:N-formylglutamate deformylase|nr:N-formylglutamate deformylase [Pseudomonadota bacterium]